MKKIKKEVSFSYKKKRFRIKAEACGPFEKFSGLMFKSKKNARILLFNFKNPTRTKIHSFFVFFPFVAVWLDDKNKAVDIKLIKPFTLPISPQKNYSKLIEIPANKKYNSLVESLCPARDFAPLPIPLCNLVFNFVLAKSLVGDEKDLNTR